MNETHIVTNWMLYFFIYSFFGWIWESCYVSVLQKKWVNRGFVKGPCLPLYGSGAIVMILVSEPFSDNLILVYFAGMIAATLLEFVTGAVMEALFKVRYWDYSNQPFNLKGYICLSSSVAWGFFTIATTEYIHPAVVRLVSLVPPLVQNLSVIVFTAAFAYDFSMAFVHALQFRVLLEKMAAARSDLLELSERLENSVRENLSSARTTIAEGWGSVLDKSGIRSRLSYMYSLFDTSREGRTLLPEGISSGVSERANQLKERFSRIIGSSTDRQRKLLNNHSHAVSDKYMPELELLKKRFRELKKEEKQ